MMRSLILLRLALLPLATAAARTVQDLWIFPQTPDYYSNITAGSTTEIRWQPDLATQFAPYCPDCDVTNVDLWVTGDDFYRKLESGIDVKTTFSYSWTVEVTDSDVESSSGWTLRFLPSDVSWIGKSGQEISSPKFNILPAPKMTSTTTPTPTPTPTSASTSTTTTTTTTTSTPTPASGNDNGASDNSASDNSANDNSASDNSANDNSASDNSASDNGASDNSASDNGASDSLSTGAKAGIGIGVSAGGLFLIALAFFLWRRLKALPAHKQPPGTGAGVNDQPPPLFPPSRNGDEIQQLEGYFAPPLVKSAVVQARNAQRVSELPGSDAAELDGGLGRRRGPTELDSTE